VRLAVWGAYAVYAVLALAFSAAAAARRGWDLLPILPAAFFVTHAGLGAGYLRGLLARRPPAPSEPSR
jgi:hypothetical protein